MSTSKRQAEINREATLTKIMDEKRKAGVPMVTELFWTVSQVGSPCRNEDNTPMIFMHKKAAIAKRNELNDMYETFMPDDLELLGKWELAPLMITYPR